MERNKLIKQLKDENWSIQDIADKFGLTVARIKQILCGRKQIYFSERIKILNKVNYKCESCKGFAKSIHHIDINPANNKLSNLMVLCSKCHKVIHRE